MKELEEFISISKYAGERFDLIQAGGGNSSVKTKEGMMYIKASGGHLSEVDKNNGYAIINNNELLKYLKNNEKTESNIIQKVNTTPQFRPSIETFIHSLLLKYTLHTHPIIVNTITCRKKWKEIIMTIFSEDNIVLVDYKTPGIELALELKNEILKLRQIGGNTNIGLIIFLQNHGLIITSDLYSDIKNLNEYVLNKIEKYLNCDMSEYKLTNGISAYINQRYNTNIVTYKSDDIWLNKIPINKLLFEKPLYPDKIVYCGDKILNMDNLQNQSFNYGYPKVVIYKNKIFFTGKNIRKAKESEEVFKSHIMTLYYSKDSKMNYLSDSEIEYLTNWEAEKFRQKI